MIAIVQLTTVGQPDLNQLSTAARETTKDLNFLVLCRDYIRVLVVTTYLAEKSDGAAFDPAQAMVTCFDFILYIYIFFF